MEAHPHESGLGICLRACKKNEINLHELRRYLGLSSRKMLEQVHARQVAKLLSIDPVYLNVALPSMRSPLDWFGQRWYRTSDLRFTRPRVCPLCINSFGYAFASWDVSVSVACSLHGRKLVDHCESCLKKLDWNRPSLSVCSCGSLIKSSWAQEAEPSLLAFQQAVDVMLYEPMNIGAQTGIDKVSKVLFKCTLSGLVCVIDAFGLKLTPSPAPASDYQKIRAVSQDSLVISRALERLDALFQSKTRLDPNLVYEAPLIRMVAHHEDPKDQRLAIFLLETVFGQRLTQQFTGRFRHIAQISLF